MGTELFMHKKSFNRVPSKGMHWQCQLRWTLSSTVIWCYIYSTGVELEQNFQQRENWQNIQDVCGESLVSFCAAYDDCVDCVFFNFIDQCSTTRTRKESSSSESSLSVPVVPYCLMGWNPNHLPRLCVLVFSCLFFFAGLLLICYYCKCFLAVGLQIFVIRFTQLLLRR